MLEGIITLAYYGLGSGGGVGNLLFNLEQLGFFNYVLPFLMIFAITFGILDKINIFGSTGSKGNKSNPKGIYIVLALAVSLMSLQFGFVSYFFSEIFPRMGVLLSVILVAVIVLGLFFDFSKSGTRQVFGWILGIALAVIIYQSLFSSMAFGWFNFGGGGWGYFWQRNLNWILIVGFVVIIIAAIVSSGKNSNHNAQYDTLGDVLGARFKYRNKI
ncbi:MAG: hypothetical protein U9Q99_02960 [Nanoarchaeota archaeon]|nr:hypothetical protein [Nanoarchaeota archaeon]